MKRNKVQVYVNDAQMAMMQARALFQIWVWGRGTGKSAGIGLRHYRRAIKLPRAKWFLTSKTYKQVLNNSLAPMMDFWRQVGLEEYDWKARRGHYVIGMKPPVHFEKPYKPPRQYEHIITFWTGYTVEIMSMDRPGPNRGGNFDGGDADEVASIPRAHLEENMIPMIRGNVDKFGEDHPLHGQFSGYTSMPWLAAGQYVLDYEIKAQEDPKMFSYHEANASCNLRALGPKWMENQRKILTPEVYDLEIENKRKKKAEGQFYHKFREDLHTYEPTIMYCDDPDRAGIAVDRYSDWNSEQLLDVAWDFGGWFTGALVFQQKHSSKDSGRVIENMIDSFYVLKGGSAQDVVDQLCTKYSRHKMKYVRLWGEPRGNDPTAHGKTLYEEVRDRFAYHGWNVELRVVHSQAHSHDRRYTFINEVLEETKRLPRLRINVETCKAPILSIQFAEKSHDLKKDKSKEKKRDFDQRLAPHFSDALDYYFMQKHYRPSSSGGKSAGTI